MSTRVCSPPSSKSINNNPSKNMNMMDALPTSGSLPSASANQANHPPHPRQFIFGEGLGLQSLRGSGLSLRGLSTSSTHSSENVPPSVRSCKAVRCLFGPPDPRSGQFAREKVREIQEQEKVKWDYDFVNDRPIEGPKRYMWEAVPVKSGSSYFSTKESGKLSMLTSPPATITAATSSSAISTSRVPESDSLLIIRSVTSSSSASATATLASSLSATSSTPTCPPPPCKQSSPERRLSSSSSPTPPEREHYLQLAPVNISRSSFSHFSTSSSSQSSPEISSSEDVGNVVNVNVNHHLHLGVGLPSPPSSLEEDNCNSRPSSPAESSTKTVATVTTTSTASKATATTTTVIPTSPTSQSKITDFMPAKKRRAGNAAATTGTTTTDTTTESGCGSPPPEKKTSL